MVGKGLATIAVALAALCLYALVGRPAASGATETDGIGARVALVCTSCHGAQAYAQIRGSRAEWRRYVYEMMLHGAQIRPEEVDPITDYLASTNGGASPAAPAPPVGATQTRSAPPPAASAGLQGAPLVRQTCTSCHDLSLVTGTRRTSPDWDVVLARMQTLGARMSVSERRTIAAYLKERYGRD